jgi:hypothetical protein
MGIRPAADVDLTRPDIARVYDFLLRWADAERLIS